MKTKILVIGAGLSGLHTAYRLHQQSIDFILIEARDRLGGRILSINSEVGQKTSNIPGIDLGPTWYWPGQFRMQSLISDLGLNESVFDQESLGDGLYEDRNSAIQREANFGSMAGSFRLKGGMGQLIDVLGSHIPSQRIRLNAVATDIRFADNELITKIVNQERQLEISSELVMLALPPRVAISTIRFEPNFSEPRLLQLNSISTWMAGHAKLVAVFEQPFWRSSGFSGDAMSQKGPLQEIHDASGMDGAPYALFGFFGIPAVRRQGREPDLKKMAVEQLVRLFGESAQFPIALHFSDWAFDPLTSTEADQKLMMFHESNQIGAVVESGWNKRLIWSGTETVNVSGGNKGYLEGALEASERSLELVTSAGLFNPV